MEFVLSLGLGVGLAAACGIRVFLPVLVMGLAARAGFLELGAGFEWMADTPALLALTAAVVFEIGAYYIPWLDNLLDTVAMPMAVVAGVMVSAASIETTSPLLQWTLAAVAGGGTAGLVRAGTALVRGATTAMTAGLGTPVVSTGENGAAAGLSVLALVAPLLVLAAVLLLVAVVGAVVWRRAARSPARAYPRQPDEPLRGDLWKSTG
ncbi:MAG: DUF4126 domain-containing protein [Acidobacteria bacterium]|nr:DUF4126 domain-containing protein [Acidobacteriota bacterium]MYJ03022.1 DUF4126 domain-containing protein [Acidobacteriota bacterium]